MARKTVKLSTIKPGESFFWDGGKYTRVKVGCGRFNDIREAEDWFTAILDDAVTLVTFDTECDDDTCEIEAKHDLVPGDKFRLSGGDFTYGYLSDDRFIGLESGSEIDRNPLSFYTNFREVIRVS